MPNTSLSGLQQTIDQWIGENGGYWDEMSLLARLTEEVGELARAYNHRFGAKKKKPEEAEGEIADELADILWLVLCMANQQGIEMEQAFDAVMTKLRVRDAGRFSAPA